MPDHARRVVYIAAIALAAVCLWVFVDAQVAAAFLLGAWVERVVGRLSA